VATIKLEVVTPTGKVLDVEADTVTAPGVLGEMGVLPEHRPGLVMLGGGALRYEAGGSEGEPVYIRGGVAEVRPDGVLVLADEARIESKADKQRAETILEASIASQRDADYLDDEQVRRIETDRAYAEAILKVAGH